MVPTDQAHGRAAGFEGYQIPQQQIAFFSTFGFARFPGLFANEIGLIRDTFDEVFAREEPQIMDPGNEFHRVHDPAYKDTPRSIIPGFLDKSEELRWLLDDPRVTSIARGLLGGDYVYAESDGNLFNCDVYWHLDTYGASMLHRYVKFYFYLDALRRDSGALQMIPGTHLRGPYAKALRQTLGVDPDAAQTSFGVEIDDVPSWTVEVEPGDLVVGDFRTLHGSFGGGVGRRLFTVNFRTAEPVTKPGPAPS